MSMDEVSIPNPIKTSDYVRSVRGLAKIDGSKIEGFGSNDAPMPEFNNPYPPLPQMVDPAGGPIRHWPVGLGDTADLPPAPWVQSYVNSAQEAPTEEVVVWYQGRKLAPNQSLLKQVERLILTELQRDVADKLKSLSDKPKRRRVLKAMNSAETPEPDDKTPEVAPTKKRGRPPGARNKPKVKPEPKGVTHEEAVDTDLTA